MTLTFNGFSQETVFWEDLADDSGNHGFTVEFSQNASGPGGTAGPPTNADFYAVVDNVHPNFWPEPANSIPAGNPWQNPDLTDDEVDNPNSDDGYVIRISGDTNKKKGNISGEIWFVFTTIDLTDTNPLIGPGASNRVFKVDTQNKDYHNANISFDVMVSTNYTGGAPSSATWTNETANTSEFTQPSSAPETWASGELNLDAYNNTTVTIAIKYDSTSNTTAWENDVNENGLWFIADPRIEVTNATASVEDTNLTTAIKLYPNPVKDILNIETLNNIIKIKHIELFDVMGKSVYQSSEDSKALNLSTLSKGLYILKLESVNGSVINKKIMIK